MSDIYIPPNTVNLNTRANAKLMVALLGRSGSGKTTSALTFPNPIVLDLDGNLIGHRGKDIPTIPIYDEAYVVDVLKVGPKKKPEHSANRRDAVLKWLTSEGRKLTAKQTLVVDSWTTLQDAFDTQTNYEPAYTKQGQIDEFAFWAQKIEYSNNVMTELKGLKCHVVITFHEQFQMDKDKQPTGKLEPLMQGKFVNKLGLYFTDFIRCIVTDEVNPTTGLVYATGAKPKDSPTKYWWQIKSSANIEVKTRMTTPRMFIEPSFSEFNYNNL